MVEHTSFIYANTRAEAIKKIKRKYGRNPHNIEWNKEYSKGKKRLYVYAVWLQKQTKKDFMF